MNVVLEGVSPEPKDANSLYDFCGGGLLGLKGILTPALCLRSRAVGVLTWTSLLTESLNMALRTRASVPDNIVDVEM